MRIQLLATMAGPDGTFRAGEVVAFDDDVAQNLIDGGYAQAVAAPGPETAMVAAPEKAVRPATKTRRTPRRKSRRRQTD